MTAASGGMLLKERAVNRFPQGNLDPEGACWYG